MSRVLFIFNPGAINFRYILLNDLAENKIQVSVALPQKLIQEWASKCPHVRFISFESFSGTSIGLLNNFKTLLSIKKLLQEENPEAVFSGNVKPNIYGGLMAHRLGIKHILGLVSGLGYAFIEEPGLKRAFVKRV